MRPLTATPEEELMSLIDQFQKKLKVGDTVLRADTNQVGKIEAIAEPTAQNPKGVLMVLWSGKSISEEVSPAEIGAAFK
jgi:hypothetical protein